MAKISSIAKVVGKYFDKQNRNITYIPFSSVQQECISWYRGLTDWHNYKIWNGLHRIGRQRASLSMAKIVCQDLAGLVFSEKLKIKASGNREQELIDATLFNNNFNVMANQLYEITCAIGTGAFVESLQGDEVVIDYIQGDMIFPLRWDNGKIIDCAFAKRGGDTEAAFCTLIIHELKEEKGEKHYEIRTIEITEEGDIVPPTRFKKGITESNIESVVKVNGDIPLFQIIKPNIVNNYDKTSPLGLSVFYNSIDTLKSIDLIYDSLRNEYQSGKRRIFVKSGLKTVLQKSTKDANKSVVVNNIDPNDTEFYSLETEDGEKVPITEFSPALRVAEHEQGLNVQLNLLSRGVTLGDGYYNFNNGAVGRTATEVISVNSALFRNLKRHELIIDKALKDMCRAILFLYDYLGGGVNFETEITVDYDDSIIEDTDKIKQSALQEYNAGLIDKVQYLAITRKMTREQALEFVKEMEETETMKDLNAGFGGFGGFGE